MPVRKGSAVWQGKLKQGDGTVRVGSGAFEGPVSYASRFENGEGTNPEELIGAAQAWRKRVRTPDNRNVRRSDHRDDGGQLQDFLHRARYAGACPGYRQGGIPEIRRRSEGYLPGIRGPQRR
jgi:hypothetical protein